MGEKEGMLQSRLEKETLSGGPAVSHHCWMWGM